MIHVHFFTIDSDGEEQEITHANMEHAPRIGEKIWLLPQSGRDSSFEVIDVAHWVGDTIPCGHHKCAVYLRCLAK